ncbi:MAG: hypothetical protein AAGA59_02065 [Actinomycetota bacterium]
MADEVPDLGRHAIDGAVGGSGPADDVPSEARWHPGADQVIGDEYNFEAISAPGGTFVFGSHGADRRRRPYSGALPADEVRQVVDGYMVRGVDKVLRDRLRTQRCLILTGRVGSGRRTAAVRALADLVGEPNVVQLDLSETGTVDDLAIDGGIGYLTDVTSIPKPGRTLGGAAMLSLRERLGDCGGYLIVIGGHSAEWSGVDVSDRLTWDPPTVRELFDGAGFGRFDELTIDRLEEVLGSEPSMADVWRLVAQLEAAAPEGRSVEDVLGRLPEASRGDAREWFANNTDPDLWVLMSALVVLSGVSQSVFSTAHARLQQLADRHRASRAPHAEEVDVPPAAKPLTSFVEQLGSCRATITPSRRLVEGSELDVPVVDFAPPSVWPVYLGECWSALPSELVPYVVEWLESIWEVDNNDLHVAIAARVAHLAHIDAESCAQLLGTWALISEPQPNRLAALTIDRLASDGAMTALALDLVERWSSRREVGMKYTTLYAYSGIVGLLRPRRAILAYRSQIKARPRGALFIWTKYSRLCAQEPKSAVSLVRLMSCLEAVDQRQLDDPAFRMLGAWFSDDDPADPPVATLLARSAGPRELLAELLAGVLAKTYRYDDWLLALAPWADSSEANVPEAVVGLVYSVTCRIPEQRQRKLQAYMVQRLGHLRSQEGGPSSLAVKRTLAAVDLAIEDVRKINE